MTELTQGMLRTLLKYDKKSGNFTHLERSVELFNHCKYPLQVCNMWNTQNAGNIAGVVSVYGYLRITIAISGEQRKYGAHVLAHLYIDGNFPDGEVDHEDHNKLNNSWNNIKNVVSKSENQKNRSINKNNSSGHNGIYWNTKDRKWQVSLKNMGSIIYGGQFKDIEDAIHKRNLMYSENNFHKNHGK